MAENKLVDVAIIGAGPAGLTAALYAKRKALTLRIFESEAVGGQAALAVWVENYPGFKKIRGSELMQQIADHLKQFGVEAEEAAEVTAIGKKETYFELDINKGEERALAKAVILCTGSKYKMLNKPGEKEFYGKGVSYCATCDGPGYKGKTVAVVGAGNSGANAALFFSGICKKVFLVEFAEKPGFDAVYQKPLEESRVELVFNTEVTAVEGKEHVEGIRTRERKTGKEERIAVDAVFVYVGMQPRNKLAKQFGLKLDKRGFVSVNEHNETSLAGVFAAGDITGELDQVVVAAGSGAVAANSVFEFVKGLK